MEKLPEDLHVDILRRLDSADVARCRAASKIFDDAYPHLRCIKLHWTIVKPSSRNLFKNNFLNLISNMRVVESLCIGLDELREYIKNLGDDLNLLTHESFIMEWLPKVSQNLKSLSITYLYEESWSRQANMLHLVSAYCHKLVELKVKNVWLDAWLSSSVDNSNRMLMLTSLTLEHIYLNEENLNKLNTCVPNLQVLNLIDVRGVSKPKIHLRNLESCHILTKAVFLPHLSLITPRLITLNVKRIESISALYVEAPVLSCLRIECRHVQDAFSLKNFENLKHFAIKSLDIRSHIGSMLYNLTTITETVEDLTLDSQSCLGLGNDNFRFTLEKLFTVFPKVTCLCIKSFAWWELRNCLTSEISSKVTQGMKGLKTLRIENIQFYNPSYFVAGVACVLDQCVGLSEVSFLICDNVGRDVLRSEIAKCVARWSRLKWRWRMYRKVEGRLVVIYEFVQGGGSRPHKNNK